MMGCLNKMVNVFIDTSVKGCTFGVFTDTDILAVTQDPTERGHAETMLPAFQELIKSIDIVPQDIENIYVSVGPGSFTGLRVGLSAARFMGYSLGKPIHGLTSFQIFSSALDTPQNRCVLIDTKRMDYYCQILDSNHEAVTEAQSLNENDLKLLLNDHLDCILIGDAVDRFKSNADCQNDTIQMPMINASMAIKSMQSNAFKFQKPDPFYIRDADVSKPKIKS
jgi:tRNA threonylcarbamoyl adenosine modification protein YeaZ